MSRSIIVKDDVIAGTSEGFTHANSTTYKGTIYVELNTGKFKFGTGDRYNNIPYVATGTVVDNIDGGSSLG